MCITDHMRSGYGVRLAQAAQRRDDITVFPGMEINCVTAPAYADAIHLLAVFPPDTSEIQIERIFAGRGLDGNPEGRSGRESVKFDDLCELRRRIHDEVKGLFILAHVENARRGHRARYRIDRGQTLAIFTDDPQLPMDIPAEYGAYLARLRPDAVEVQRESHQSHYARFTVDGEDHRLACVGPADHHSFEEYERASMATLLKIPGCDFSSVREALRFHETRVRLSGQPTEHVAPRLVGLRLTSPDASGLFADTTVAFSPNLTCLIGPRGSGKSTVIEALRYVLGRNRQLVERSGSGSGEKSFADLAVGTQVANLRNTRLELLYEVDGQQTVLSAAYDDAEPQTTRGFSLTGDDLHLSAEALLSDFPVAIFSWSEMEVLGRDPGPQRELVDRLLGDIAPLVDDRETIRGRLAENREEIARLVTELERARAANNGRLGRYRQYKDAYDAINTDDAVILFEGLDTARKRSELIDSARRELEGLEETTRALADVSVSGKINDAVGSTDARTAEWWRQGPAQELAFAELDREIKTLAQQLALSVSRRRASLERLNVAAVEAMQSVEQELRKETRLDDTQDLLRDQRERARTRFELVAGDRDRYIEKLAALDAALAARDELLAALDAAVDAVSALRERNLIPLNDQLAEIGGNEMEIAVERDLLADRGAVSRYIEDSVLTMDRAGQYRHRRTAERMSSMNRPSRLSSALVSCAVGDLEGDRSIDAGGALDAAEAEKLVTGCEWRKTDEDAGVDVVDSSVVPLLLLAEQPIDDRVRIKLNGRPVDELSPGQRSSAMLPLIALAETDPLVIDQPEDNLDNAMVGRTLTRILADLKQRRQIVVSTHNPNIVVGGDAEQVVVLRASAAHSAEVAHTGSIDDEAIIESVLTIMEGGREAFVARQKRYRVEQNDNVGG